MRAAIFLGILAVSPMTLAQVPVPPPPPPPTSGSIECELKDESGEATNVKGELTQTDLIEGKRYPRINFKSEKENFSGIFGANWSPQGGQFTSAASGEIITSMTLVTPTYKSGPGAMVAAVNDYGNWRNIPKYYVGFCQFTNFNDIGN